MTFQPPPPPPGTPPPGGTPPPPPPGQWGPPPGGQPGGGSFDPKSVNPLDWGILGAGVLAFIFSLFDYYTASYGPYSESESAWHGFFGWFSIVLAIIGSGVIAAELFSPQTKLPVAARLAGLIAYAVAFISAILALLVFPDDVPDQIDTGRGFGYWVSLIAIIAGTVLSLMRAQQTNTALPGPLSNIPKIGS